MDLGKIWKERGRGVALLVTDLREICRRISAHEEKKWDVEGLSYREERFMK